MTRSVSSYRLPTLTLEQIDKLATQTGMSNANVISFAIDRMYQQEIQMNTANANAKIVVRRKPGKHINRDILIQVRAGASGEGKELWCASYWPDSPASCEAAYDMLARWMADHPDIKVDDSEI